MQTVFPANEEVHLAAAGGTANDLRIGLTTNVKNPTPSASQPKQIDQPSARPGVTLYITMIAVVAAPGACCLASTPE
jgi:hypothetical protein